MSDVKRPRRSRADLIGEKPRSHNGGKGDGGRSANPYRDELYREQARIARLKGDKLAGELVARVDVQREWASAVTETRQRLLAIPSRIGAKLGLDRKQVEAIDSEIRSTLTALAGVGGPANGGGSPNT